jgi:hypothetical protein
MIMSVTATAIASLFHSRLKADAALAAWAQATFGKPVTVIAGASPKRPPREADAPYVVVDAMNAERGQVAELRFTLAVDLGVKMTPGQDVLAVKTLLEQEFSARVEAVLAGASGNIDFAEIADEFEESFDPLIILEKTLIIAVPNLVGGAVEL